MNKKLNCQAGLTLLEMMIVIAIISILAATAIPNYQRYFNRAKFSEVIQSVTPYKTAVMLCFYQQGDLSLCAMPGQNGIPEDFESTDPQKGYVKSITVGENGIITAVTQGIQVDNCKHFTYTLVPQVQANGSLTWRIDTSKPNSCKYYHLY